MRNTLQHQNRLLIPGPVSLSDVIRPVMLDDHSAGEPEMIEALRAARRYLTELARAEGWGTTIPFPGSATYANEAVIRTFVPNDGRLLVHSNGAYGDWLITMCRRMEMPHVVLRTPPTRPPTSAEFRKALALDSQITHVMMVHVETSSGLLNPIEMVADLCSTYHKGLLVDAVASFGALPIDMKELNIQALVLSSNKCIEGPPGLAWVICDRAALECCEGNARSLSLDLWDQDRSVDRTGCFRFTPPTHSIRGAYAALELHRAEGGSAARLRRYHVNRRRLVNDMRNLGFQTLLADAHAAPIVATFYDPNDEHYDFGRMYDGLASQGLIIVPGRLAVPGTFRIGCIGALTEDSMSNAVGAIRDVLHDMGVQRFGAGPAALGAM
ncbi:2-aminoethylphosphonate--pyruvate transaminase [Bradyrhizobium sp. 142]|uniref:2-aminoethylphosphonate--pyruvate transaminase n=1 Tax=Bradyrhizobium sp. 142 TaxID=2782618 RepID=UPI001FF9D356|nr:2-aminoethylphosphonate--pyruvate transaminase [Bradyrhizobium sp. 142]MCK1732326.1 2-aminoethylphosphonate--pyruvate transaminase [Bradyrhizobium sp. 142]